MKIRTIHREKPEALLWPILALAAILLVLALSSCTVLEQVKATTAALNEVAGTLKDTVKAIDADQSGTIEPQEGIDWVTGGGLAGLIAVISGIYLRWKSSVTKKDIHARIDRVANGGK